MVEFRREKSTGLLYAYKNGKRVGQIIAMGDEVGEEHKKRVDDTKRLRRV